jgi:HPt (histidine-containing phosphotransfer) domain-containing protein
VLSIQSNSHPHNKERDDDHLLSTLKRIKMSDLEGIDVIDWDEAMQQCGDDEEFLLELLGDLRDETDGQMARMEEIVQNPTDNAFVGFIRAAHVIKGAASNLMCEQLRKTAMELETIATNAQSAATKKKKREQGEGHGAGEGHEAEEGHGAGNHRCQCQGGYVCQAGTYPNICPRSRPKV